MLIKFDDQTEADGSICLHLFYKSVLYGEGS